MRLISRLIVGGFAIAAAESPARQPRQRGQTRSVARSSDAVLRGADPGGDELDRLKDTLQTIYRKDWAAANALAGNLKYPLTKKIARWYYFKVSGIAGAGERNRQVRAGKS